ncbi:hypothetical protein [Pseudomonas putida]|uniref:hypothetical protein n=1 Tax=Pseudomonas putida TaxID=303 RepID=UPI001EE7B49E|nr:hypothetical protein [Pseudomonas putida]
MSIDTTGFEHGMPTYAEMMDHQCQLLCNENDVLRQRLMQAQANIQKLVDINSRLQEQQSAEFKRANAGHVRLVMILNRLRCIHGIDASTWFPD